MRAYSVPVELGLVSRHGYRRVPAALAHDARGGLDPSAIVLDIHDEAALCRDALRTHPDADAEACPQIYGEAALSRWPLWPTRLGRDPAVPNGAPLAGQLAALRARRPDRRHFRLAIVGGFGTNLGDALLGATAWRAALPILQAGLPSVAADALLGPTAHAAVADLLGGEPGIDRVRFQPPTLEAFARYDAFFDFTDLIDLPRFHERAHLDWLLWWLGLDPAAVPEVAKRNRLRLPEPDLARMRARIATAPGPRIVFVWQASTPLRSMPAALAAAFARDLLAAAPAITLVVDRPLALEHPRLLTIEAGSAVAFAALVAAADGLVSVDTFAPHVADAADLPCVLILNSLPPARFPYYPNMATVVPPEVEALPGWGRTKVAESDWPAVEDAYARAWAEVSAAVCWDRLAARLLARPGQAERGAAAIATTPRPPSPPSSTAGLLPYDRPEPLDRWIGAEMARFAAAVLAPGRTAVLAGGDSELALALGALVSEEGELHVLEPRRLRAQALAAAAQSRGIACLHPHPIVAAADDGVRRIARFDPDSEGDPAQWGNVPGEVEVAVGRLDGLRLAACDLLAIRPPHDWAEALAGGGRLLSVNRPLLLVGPIRTIDHASLRECLTTFSYEGGLSAPAGMRVEDGALLLASPREAGTRLEGFCPLTAT